MISVEQKSKRKHVINYLTVIICAALWNQSRSKILTI